MNTFRIELDLDYQFIETTIRDIANWYMIRIPELTLISMIKQSPYILGEMSEVGLDTVGRERVIDCFLKFIGIDDDWPINGDPENVKKDFYTKLIEKLTDLGIPNSI